MEDLPVGIVIFIATFLSTFWLVSLLTAKWGSKIPENEEGDKTVKTVTIMVSFIAFTVATLVTIALVK